MATISGNDGTVYSGANAVAEVKSFSYEASAELLEDTAMGDVYKSYLGGLKDGSGSLECHYDRSDTAQATLNPGDTVTLKLRPQGDGSTVEEWVGSATITGMSISQDKNDVVAVTYSFQGWLTEGTQT